MAFEWRKHLKEQYISDIQQSCEASMKLLGYNPMQNIVSNTLNETYPLLCKRNLSRFFNNSYSKIIMDKALSTVWIHLILAAFICINTNPKLHTILIGYTHLRQRQQEERFYDRYDPHQKPYLKPFHRTNPSCTLLHPCTHLTHQ